MKDTDWKILLIYKSDTEDVNPNSFDIPWWRVNRWEKLEEAIKREVKEEVNLDIEIDRISRSRWFTKWDMYLVWITYVVKCQNTNNIKLSEEHTWYFWKNKNEILDGDFPDWLKEEVKAS